MTIRAAYSTRQDGLGGRLTALLTAMRLAELLGIDLKFTWTGLGTWALDFNPVDGHSIAAPDEFFNQDFLDRHLIDRRRAPELPELAPHLKLTLQDFRELLERDGAIHVNYLPLSEMCAEDFPESSLKMRDCFDRIGFSGPIRDAVESAQNVDIAGPMTALHIRGGDIIYGSWRKRVQGTYKGMAIPVAKMMMEWALERGHSIVCFGHDGDVLDYLSHEYGVINGSALSAKFGTEAQRAIFEIALMSRATQIIAGTSTFAKLAASLDGIPIQRPEQVSRKPRREEAIIRDLRVNADTYNRFHTAFAYWYLYYDRRNQRPSRANIEWLNKAQEYDRDNRLYTLVKAALLYKIEADDEAERVVEYALATDAARGEREVLEVLANPAHNLKDYHRYFREASLRGWPFASVLHAVVERAKGAQGWQRILFDPTLRNSVGQDILALLPSE